MLESLKHSSGTMFDASYVSICHAILCQMSLIAYVYIFRLVLLFTAYAYGSYTTATAILNALAV